MPKTHRIGSFKDVKTYTLSSQGIGFNVEEMKGSALDRDGTVQKVTLEGCGFYPRKVMGQALEDLGRSIVNEEARKDHFEGEFFCFNIRDGGMIELSGGEGSFYIRELFGVDFLRKIVDRADEKKKEKGCL